MASAPVVLITGGTAGLGAAAARHFAKNGFRVVVNYASNVERANKLLDELKIVGKQPTRPNGINYIAVKADLAHRDAINRLVQEAISVMGHLDVVFSNGGWTEFRNMSSLDENVFEVDWDRAFNMNVKSHLWLLHAAQEHLEKTDGSFIATASLAGVSQQGSSLVFLENNSSKQYDL
jgi:NAD(P)-dependent dehydrogenase (short-subunit alcohol dehydrogenase family)